MMVPVPEEKDDAASKWVLEHTVRRGEWIGMDW